MVVSFFLSMYYNVINAWAFWYLFHSFQVSGRARAGREQEGRAAHRGRQGGAGQGSVITEGGLALTVHVVSLSGPQ